MDQRPEPIAVFYFLQEHFVHGSTNSGVLPMLLYLSLFLTHTRACTQTHTIAHTHTECFRFRRFRRSTIPLTLIALARSLLLLCVHRQHLQQRLNKNITCVISIDVKIAVTIIIK